MPEISRNFLRDQVAVVDHAEAGLRKVKISAMDTVADGITGRAVGSDDMGVPVPVEELLFTHFGLKPHSNESEEVKSQFSAIGEQFGEASWGQLFSIQQRPVNSRHFLHAVDGSDARAWKRSEPMWPYSPLQYRLERWNSGDNATYIGKIVIPNVFSVSADFSSDASKYDRVKQHGLVLMTFSRSVGNAAVSSSNIPKPNIYWGLDVVEGINRSDVAAVADVAIQLKQAKEQIHAAPEFQLPVAA